MAIFLVLLSALSVFAHGDDEEHEENSSDYFSSLALMSLKISSMVVLALIGISAWFEKQLRSFKHVVFWCVVVVVMASTLLLVGSTIYSNITSATGGPVHWHADFEVYRCGQKISLADPKELSNRVGNSVFHEHNDDRIHVEGTIADLRKVDLHSFFEVTGGYLGEGYSQFLTEVGKIEMHDGDLCDGQPVELQVFVYKTIVNRVVQQKLRDYHNYILSPHMNVPPGDCIIIEFDVPKEKTSHMCETYHVALSKGEIHGS